VSIISLSVLHSTAYVEFGRYNIATKQNTINRPYLFVFDRMQVVGEEMVSWGTNTKKRPHDSAMAGPSKRLPPDPGPSKPRFSSEDEL